MSNDRTTVLVVDGDPDTVETLRKTDGMGVLSESDPESALAVVEEAAVYCVVACGSMDRYSKPATVERLQRSDRFADVPVVLYPEDGDAALVGRALEDLATDSVVDAGTPESRPVLRHRVRARHRGGGGASHDWTVDLVESDDGGARFEVRGVTREE